MNEITKKKFYYYRKKYIKYRNLLMNEKEREFDRYKTEHNNQFICGIDNGICLENRCARDFDKYGCMYLKW